jgi:hypothetical protein
MALLAARDVGVDVPKVNLGYILQWMDSVTDKKDFHLGYAPAQMTKVNIATHLNNAFTTALRQHLAEDLDVVDTRRYLGTARDAVAAEAARLLSLLALR